MICLGLLFFCDNVVTEPAGGRMQCDMRMTIMTVVITRHVCRS